MTTYATFSSPSKPPRGPLETMPQLKEGEAVCDEEGSLWTAAASLALSLPDLPARCAIAEDPGTEGALCPVLPARL